MINEDTGNIISVIQLTHEPHLTAIGALLPNKYVQVLPSTELNHCPHNGTTAGASTSTNTSTGTLSNYPETIET